MPYDPKEFSDLHSHILEKEAKTGIHTISQFNYLNSDENSDILSLCSKNNENQSKEENLATLYQKINKQDKNKKAKTKSTFNSPYTNNRRPAPTMSMQLDINCRPVPIMGMQLDIHKPLNYKKDSNEVTRVKGNLFSLSAQKLEKFEAMIIKPDFDYDSLASLSSEAKEKLKKIKPKTPVRVNFFEGEAVHLQEHQGQQENRRGSQIRKVADG